MAAGCRQSCLRFASSYRQCICQSLQSLHGVYCIYEDHDTVAGSGSGRLPGILGQIFIICCLTPELPLGLHHHFELYNWSVAALQGRRTLLLVKSVQIHNPLKPKIKGILSVDMLKGLMSVLTNVPNAIVYQSIYLIAFFGFFSVGIIGANCHSCV